MGGRRRDDRLRRRITEEAARLMYFEGVGEYYNAKRVAARRVLGKDARGARFRPGELPSNGDIRNAVRALADLAEGRVRGRRLFAMRVEALQLMRALDAWHPRLIGSVATGHARQGSDIDLHVFVDSAEALEADLDARGMPWARRDVLIRVGDDFRTFIHIELTGRPFPVELSLHGPGERRITTRSSTDGKPIDRVTPARLEALLRTEHPSEMAAWEATGAVEPWEEQGRPGAFDGLLRELEGG